MKTSREIAIQCIKDEAEAVLGLIPQLDESFDKAIELILNCKGKVIVTGVGKSGHIGAKIAATWALYAMGTVHNNRWHNLQHIRDVTEIYYKIVVSHHITTLC